MTRQHVLGIRSLAAKYAHLHLKGIFGEEFDYYAVSGKADRADERTHRKNGIEKKAGT